jgi:hypothetical protein
MQKNNGSETDSGLPGGLRGNDAVKTAFSRTASLFARMACTMDLWVWHSMVRGFPTAGLQKGRHL